MKQLQITIILLFFVQLSFGQELNIINNQAIQFNIESQNDEIDFILVDTKLDKVKPVFLFCQGSLPIPLFVKPEKEDIWMIGGGVTNFDLNEIQKVYHLIIISMPHTPVVADENTLNKSYCYIPDRKKPDEFDMRFTKSDYLENYANRATAVLKFLRKQKWVDNSKLIVAGHSQGSKVATLVTLNNRKVTHLGLFGANPFGRIDQNIRSYRKQAESNAITWQEASEQIENTYKMYRDSHDKELLSKNPELLAWKSFSRPLLNEWLKIKIPTYLAYGTNDIASDLCDIVPLFYIQNSKENLTHKRYLNLEHNFFEVKEDGRANYEKDHWPEVMSEFIKWTEK